MNKETRRFILGLILSFIGIIGFAIGMHDYVQIDFEYCFYMICDLIVASYGVWLVIDSIK